MMNPIREYIDREQNRKQRIYSIYLENLNAINSKYVYGHHEEGKYTITYYHPNPTDFPDKTYCMYSDEFVGAIMYQVDINGAIKL